jgi:hypothetical protein
MLSTQLEPSLTVSRPTLPRHTSKMRPKSGSFVDAAKIRQQRQMGHIKEQSYDPSSKVWCLPALN